MTITPTAMAEVLRALRLSRTRMNPTGLLSHISNWPSRLGVGPGELFYLQSQAQPDMAAVAFDKSDVALALEVLRHYSQRLERFEDEREAEKRFTGVYLDDVGAEINSIMNLTNRIKDLEAIEIKDLTVEEAGLLEKGVALFNEDAVKLKAQLKSDLPKVELKTATLDLKLAQVKALREKLETEG